MIARTGTSTVGVFGLVPGSADVRDSSLGKHPDYRFGQILDWIYRKGAGTFDEMTNLPLELRRALAAEFHIFESLVLRDDHSTDGTRKLLLRWSDGATSECVLIPDGSRRTACISTQVGCPAGCVFCASGIGGLERQLTAGQIMEQAVRIASLCGDRGLTHVVFMGLGEPLHNYDATVHAVRAINAGWGLNVGARHITVSTVGLPKQIRRLATEKLQITLAISLHAPNDELRREIVPWARSIGLAELISAGDEYFDQTGREVTLEYVLLGGVNDQAGHARELADLVRRMRCHVNLIRYNPVPGLPFERPTGESAATFQRILREKGINVHMRRSRGLDIDGACGQLRRRNQPSP